MDLSLLFILTEAVISSVNMPTIPLSVAQTMSPPPRPPSPAARDATQRAMRRENTSQLSSRDTRVLGLSPENRLTSNISDITGDNTTLGGDGSTLGPPTPHVDHTPRASSAPVRPVRRQNENNVKSVPVEAVRTDKKSSASIVLICPVQAPGC